LTWTSQTYEYVDVPVEGSESVTVSTWVAGIVVALTVGAAAASSFELTVIVADAAEVTVTGVVALSVTFSSKL
jgi:hypothetical protein